jgi:hypothetical protein
MSLADILSHLDQRFRLLTGGRRSALSRQQTLRGAIDWSLDLLDNLERTLLRRLAAFAGGFDLAAAETVGEGGPVDALDVAVLLDYLVDKSLVVADPSGPSSRFRLLETIRDYMWDRLRESGETEDVSRRHAQYYQAFAAAADRGLRGPDEVSWTEQVERDLDNLRAAVSWAANAGEVDMALEIIASLATGFGTRIGAPFGPIAERAASMPEAHDHPLRCVALASAARSALDRGEGDRARWLAEEALDASAALQTGRASANARIRTISGVLVVLFPDIVDHAQDVARYRDLSERRLAAAIELDDSWEKAFALVQSAGRFLYDDPARAIADTEEALRLARQLANPNALTYAPMTAGMVIAHTDPSRAETLFDEAIRNASAVRNHFAEIKARLALGRARTMRGDHLRAALAYLGAAELANRVGDRLALFHAVGGIACNLAQLGDQEPALLFATWAERHGRWPPDWASHPPFETSPALSRLQTETTPETRQKLQDRAQPMADAEATALARATLEALSED